jgi:hypothetical protein
VSSALGGKRRGLQADHSHIGPSPALHSIGVLILATCEKLVSASYLSSSGSALIRSSFSHPLLFLSSLGGSGSV